MNSKKRKEKILKQINKDNNHSGGRIDIRVGAKDSKAPKKEPQKEKISEPIKKKPMYSNDKVMKDDRLKDKIFKERNSYQKSREAAHNSITDKIFSKIRKYRNKWMGMNQQQKYKMIGAWTICLVILVVIVGVISSSIKSDSKKDKQEADNKKSEGVSTEDTSEATTEEVNTNPVVLCDNEAVTTLINSYMAAMSSNDVDTMKTLDMCADSYSSVNDYKNMAKVVEGFQNIKVYSKNGPYEGGYLLYVVADVKFKGIDKTCQGMYRFIARLQEDGSYKIDTTPDDSIEDDDISNMLISMDQSSDVLALYDSVNQQAEQDLEADANLKAYVEALENGTVTTTEETTEKTTEETKKAKKKKKKKKSE